MSTVCDHRTLFVRERYMRVLTNLIQRDYPALTPEESRAFAQQILQDANHLYEQDERKARFIRYAVQAFREFRAKAGRDLTEVKKRTCKTAHFVATALTTGLLDSSSPAK
jgi:hypothetical protein